MRFLPRVLITLFIISTIESYASDVETTNSILLNSKIYQFPPVKNNRLLIYKEGEKYMDIDLEYFYRRGGKYILAIDFHTRIGNSLHPVSPDSRYIPIKISEENNKLYMLIVDLENKKADKLLISDDFHFSKIYSIRWITNTKMMIEGAPDHYVFDISNPAASRGVINEYGIAWDSQKENTVSIYGKLGYHLRHRKNLQGDIYTLPDDSQGEVVSEAIKYNGYFVYPVETQGYPGEWIYSEPNSRRNMPPDCKHPEIDYAEISKKVFDSGVLLDRMHVFSAPVFIADTHWAACMEQVYTSGQYEKMEECNIVFIDGHNIGSVPPKPDELKIIKYPIEKLEPSSKAEWRGMILELKTKWNPVSKTLDIWQDNKTKLYEISIIFDETPKGINKVKFLHKGKQYKPLIHERDTTKTL